MSNDMTDYADPLRIAADTVIQRIIALASKSAGTDYDANALVVWIGNELVRGVQEHDNIHVEKVISQIGIKDAPEDEDDDDEDDGEYSVAGGYVIDETEVKRLHKDFSKTPGEGSIIERIFGEGIIDADDVSLMDGASFEEPDSVYRRIEMICDILDIDVEDLVNFEPEDPDDYLDIEFWMKNRNFNDNSAREFEAELRTVLKNKIRMINRRKPRNPKTSK